MSISASNIYNQVLTLIPAGTYTSYKVIQTTILGNTVQECSTTQEILLWVFTSIFAVICFIFSITANKNVTYNKTVTLPTWFNKVFYTPLIHALFATAAFIVVVIIDPVTFDCLFSNPIDPTVASSVPISVGVLLVTVYSLVFDLPTSRNVVATTTAV